MRFTVPCGNAVVALITVLVVVSSANVVCLTMKAIESGVAKQVQLSNRTAKKRGTINENKSNNKK